jgi:TfoX/Sxy family transcriptional regulator of competence genes
MLLSKCARWGTKEAIRRLVISGDIQSGFKKAQELGLLDWSLEAAVLKFPDEFDSSVRQAAQWRLDQARGRR